MNFRKKRESAEPEINLIPFIDVLLVILIFLMVTTTYSKYTELQIVLPAADGQKMLQRPRELNVFVDAMGGYAINKEKIKYTNTQQLAQSMLKRAPEITPGMDIVVIVSADAHAPHQRVINVLEAARMAGFDKLTFATQTGRE